MDSGEHTETSVGHIFASLNFFVVRRVPLRQELVEKIENNGGKVVMHESVANYVIADHARKDTPPESISWTFIDASIDAKALVNPGNHRAGPERAARLVGSVIPGKSTRTPFTADDDRILWQWVEDSKLSGARIGGNEIYKQLEAKNPRHTFQAWRHRYLKRLIDRPPPASKIMVPANAPPTPPAVTDVMNVTEPGREPLSEDKLGDAGSGKESRVKESATRILRVDSQDGQADFQDRILSTNGRNTASRFSDNTSVREAANADSDDGFGRKRTQDFEGTDSQQPDSEAAVADDFLDSVVHPVGDQNRMPKRHRTQGPRLIDDERVNQKRLPATRSQMKGSAFVDRELDTITKETGWTIQEGDNRTNPKSVGEPGIDVGIFDGDVPTAKKPPKTPLTVANLASQQAQEKRRPTRGVDLPEDDQMQDQTHFAEYLRETLSRSIPQGTGTPEPRHSMMQPSDVISTAKMGQFLNDTLSADKTRESRSWAVRDPSSSIRTSSPDLRADPESPDLSVSDQLTSNVSRQSCRSDDDIVASQLEDVDDVDLTIPSPEAALSIDEQLVDDNSQVYTKPIQFAAEMIRKSPTHNKAALASIIEISSLATSSASDDTPTHFRKDFSVRRQKEGRHHGLDTQDIVNAETQYPDLEIPLPPDTDDDNDRSSPQSPTPHRHTSPLSQTGQYESELEKEETSQDLSAWAQTMIQRGYTAAAIISALGVCCARSDLAELILFETRSGRGIPKDVPGIWSEGDDIALEGGDARGIKRLEEIHGWDECNVRLQYLAEQRRIDNQ